MSKLLKNRSFVEVVVWLGVTAFVIIARAIYYANSHDLTSPYMDWAFAVPLGLCLLNLVLFLIHKDNDPYARLLLNAGDATLTVFLFLAGIYDMASNDNPGTIAFLIIGVILLVLGFLATVYFLFRHPSKGVANPENGQ